MIIKMLALTNALLAMEQTLQRINQNLLMRVQYAIPGSEILAKCKSHGIVSTDLVELFSWRNGRQLNFEIPIYLQELLPDCILLNFEEAIDIYSEYAVKSNLWHGNLFPIFTNGGGDYYLLEITKGVGQVMLYAPSLLLSKTPVVIFSNLQSLFVSEIACFDEGAFNYDTGLDEFIIDYDMRSEIFARLNPGIAHWNKGNLI